MLTLQKGFCILTLRCLWESEPITLSRLEIGLKHGLTVGGEKEFDVLVNMHAGLSQPLWARSQVERCGDQVLTMLKAHNWALLESRTTATFAGKVFYHQVTAPRWYEYDANKLSLNVRGLKYRQVCTVTI